MASTDGRTARHYLTPHSPRAPAALCPSRAFKTTPAHSPTVIMGGCVAICPVLVMALWGSAFPPRRSWRHAIPSRGGRFRAFGLEARSCFRCNLVAGRRGRGCPPGTSHRGRASGHGSSGYDLFFFSPSRSPRRGRQRDRAVIAPVDHGSRSRVAGPLRLPTRTGSAGGGGSAGRRVLPRIPPAGNHRLVSLLFLTAAGSGRLTRSSVRRCSCAAAAVGRHHYATIGRRAGARRLAISPFVGDAHCSTWTLDFGSPSHLAVLPTALA